MGNHWTLLMILWHSGVLSKQILFLCHLLLYKLYQFFHSHDVIVSSE
ncbi:hypothetical protein MtrunA17_Chr6g0478821 [Medicago truncatula]|uniref:Uncharacterized protein n=1 Tax=Medicago truncatula TaxID=3880 RepID=A0A396HG03_MEDTR|nr:hypothetical protein MtrunA17_Chr6g0478821 [Medicago truncatula]